MRGREVSIKEDDDSRRDTPVTEIGIGKSASGRFRIAGGSRRLLLISAAGKRSAPSPAFLGDCHVLDLRLDQEYLRSQPVNSEEGAPMGIGIWYEMWIDDPVAFLFKNTDPRGSLRANLTTDTAEQVAPRPVAYSDDSGVLFGGIDFSYELERTDLPCQNASETPTIVQNWPAWLKK